MNTETTQLQETQAQWLANQQDTNNVLTTNNVSPMFQGHVFNMVTGEHGIENLIISILRQNNSILPKGIENSNLRNVAIASAMFASDIMAIVESYFTAGSTRYRYETIHQYLSVFMFRKGTIGKIKLSNNEDKPRSCFKPRCKWYLVE